MITTCISVLGSYAQGAKKLTTNWDKGSNFWRKKIIISAVLKQSNISAAQCNVLQCLVSVACIAHAESLLQHLITRRETLEPEQILVLRCRCHLLCSQRFPWNSTSPDCSQATIIRIPKLFSSHSPAIQRITGLFCIHSHVSNLYPDCSQVILLHPAYPRLFSSHSLASCLSPDCS